MQDTPPICKSCPVHQFAVNNPESPMCPMLNNPLSNLAVPLEEIWDNSDECQFFTCDEARVAVAIQGALQNQSSILNIQVNGEDISAVNYGSTSKPKYLGRYAEVGNKYRLFITDPKTGEILQQANYLSQDIKHILCKSKPAVLDRFQRIYISESKLVTES